MRLHRELSIGQKAAWFLLHRLRQAYFNAQDVFGGPFGLDETYVGGKGKNEHESKKLNAGRGGIGAKRDC